MTYLRHFEGDWFYDCVTRDLVLKGGVRIPLCSERRPRQNARPILRRGEYEWQVAPCEYKAGFFKRIPDGEFLVLTHTPPTVSTHLWELL